MNETDTIASIATPYGVGGIGIVRISGESAAEVLASVFTCATPVGKFEDRKLYLGKLTARGFSDRCLAVRFYAPNSYTGEEVAEIQCHGGRALTAGVLDAVLSAGARLAEPGEFTKRAFLNGKISLSGAEGVIDMIEAESEAGLNAGAQLMRGELNRTAQEFQNLLTDVICRVEVTLDYPEEDIELSDFSKELTALSGELLKLERSYRTGRMLRDGVTVAVAGKPNVGKSSLMNRLLNFDRAIVTPNAGTTRDTLETAAVIHGVKVNLVDTAGIRDAEDEAEKLGVVRAREAVTAADLVLFVLDASEPATAEDMELMDILKEKRVIAVLNKNDAESFRAERFALPQCWKKTEISALNGEGVSILKDSIAELVSGGMAEGGFVLTNARHLDAVRRARLCLDDAVSACTNGAGLDAVALELKRAWDALGEITGETATEEIIDRIFSKFCLGK